VLATTGPDPNRLSTISINDSEGPIFGGRNAGWLVRIADLVLLGGVGAPWLAWLGHREVLARIGMDRDLVSAPGVEPTSSLVQRRISPAGVDR